MATASSRTNRIIHFSTFELDLAAGELRRNGTKIRLQEQPLQILVTLIERPGELVRREELRAKLWPADTFVDFDHGLNAAVRRLRDALGDSAETPRFVETVARRGYRFIAPVQGLVSPTGEPFPVGGSEVQSARKPQWRRTALVAGLLSLAVGSSWWFLRPVRPKRQVTERRLTANPDDVPVTSAVISPDGKYLAFTDKTGFYLRQVDDGETHAIPLQKGFDGQAESWFPDSTHLVVSWVEDPKKPSSLWEISIMGGTPRKLYDDGAFARVSPDGSKIAFLRSNNEEIWLMADGDPARRIVSGEESYFGPMAWAPGGMRFAYVRTKYHYGSLDLDTQIEVYDVTSARAEVVLPLSGLAEDVGWANAGRLIYSLQEPLPNGNDFNLWSVQLDSRTARPLDSGTRITSGRGSTAGISITRDGKRMAFWRRTIQPDVYVAQLEAQGKKLSKPQRLTLDERQDFPWSWTPDSKAVLFTSNRDGAFHIFKQGIDQTQPELLVGGNKDLDMPRLSPDGSMMLYSKLGEPSFNSRLMRVPLAGGPSQFVLEAPGIINYECARLPSTLCIYSQIEANQQRFFTFDPMSGEGTELLAAKMKKEDGDNYNWGLSPDGKYLATHQFYGSQKVRGLRILPLAGGSARFIPISGWLAKCGLDWAADSKSVWVAGQMARTTSQSEYKYQILNMDLNGKVRTMLADYDRETGPAVPSPDGRRLAFFGSTYNSNVWLLDSF
jgi:Tol biopolymer transport system component/DNA-binding winged helix-turn-helix (wHTH) protein